MGGRGRLPRASQSPVHCWPLVNHGAGGLSLSEAGLSRPEASPTLEVTISNLHESFHNERFMKTHVVPDMLVLGRECYNHQLPPPPPPLPPTQQVLNAPLFRGAQRGA